MLRIDLNCDLGEQETAEGCALDSQLMQWVSSVNVACGAHAGSVERIQSVVQEAAVRGVAVGAHPGFPDRTGFGRAVVDMPAARLQESLESQISSVLLATSHCGLPLQHVKPHGALYHLATADRSVARVVLDAVRCVSPTAAVYAPSRSLLQTLAADCGMCVVAEAFADRRYLADGCLAPRTDPRAVLTDTHAAAAQALQLCLGNPISDLHGGHLQIPCGTVCLHSDSPNAIELAAGVHQILKENGFRILPPSLS